MSATQIRWSRGLVIAIGLLVVLLGYAQSTIGDAPEMSARERAELERSQEASEAEAAIARTNIASKLEAALGDDFGGVWFDPDTAQLYVGVTSPESRRNAEAVAAQEGLVENVTETSVRWTWARLEAEQERWNRLLADLFERGEVSTSLVASYNAVNVRLSSSVAMSRREALESDAAASDVNVLIDIAPRSEFLVSRGTRCRKFAKFEAFCNPTIVAGVVVDSEAVGGKSASCTGGPAAILKNRDEKSAATKTYVLTAGHCLENGGGEGKKWYAYNKSGEEGEEELGTAGPFLNGATDVGAIEMSTKYWAEEKKPIPVEPTIAEWSAAADFEPTAVKSQTNPTEGITTCFSGQRSGKGCGEIEEVNVKIKFEGSAEETERLFKVKLENGAKGGQRDSGGPFYSKASPSAAEGVFVGYFNEGNEEGSTVYFHSLTTSFETLEIKKGLALELLHESNKKRHGKFKASKYPVTIHGSTTSTVTFATEAGTVECKESTYHAVLSEATSTLTVTPVYKGCSAFENSATVSMEGCTYVYHVTEKASADNYRAHKEISCPEGKAIKIDSGNCKLDINAQTERETVDIIDDTSASPKKDITLQPTVTGVTYTVTGDKCTCPFNGIGSKADGEFTSDENITLTGQNPSSPSEKIDIEVADE